MKNIFLLSALCFLIATSKAQSTVLSMTGSGDTVTNTGSKTLTGSPTKTHQNLSFEVVVTKISGTVGGKAKLYGSLDGTNYIDLSDTDSLVLTNTTTNKYIWPLTGTNYQYYKAIVTGTGTMSASITGKMYASGSIATNSTVIMKSSYNLSSDTITNAATGYVGLSTSSWYNSITIQAVVTKLSGTAGGTVTLQGSNDGTNYVTVSGTYASRTTLSVTNQTTNTASFIITGNPYKYYRLSYTGTGTMSCTLKGYLKPTRLQ